MKGNLKMGCLMVMEELNSIMGKFFREISFKDQKMWGDIRILMVVITKDLLKTIYLMEMVNFSGQMA